MENGVTRYYMKGREKTRPFAVWKPYFAISFGRKCLKFLGGAYNIQKKSQKNV